jgi:hypothetical protein
VIQAFFKREKASARASSDRFSLSLSLSILKPQITQNQHPDIQNPSTIHPQRIPKEFQKNSKRIPIEFQKNSNWIPKEYPKN